jgi:hypothetical protein
MGRWCEHGTPSACRGARVALPGERRAGRRAARAGDVRRTSRVSPHAVLVALADPAYLVIPQPLIDTGAWL